MINRLHDVLRTAGHAIGLLADSPARFRFVGPRGSLEPRIRELVARSGAADRVEISGLGHWACVGAYASVAQPGRLGVGDSATL